MGLRHPVASNMLMYYRCCERQPLICCVTSEQIKINTMERVKKLSLQDAQLESGISDTQLLIKRLDNAARGICRYVDMCEGARAGKWNAGMRTPILAAQYSHECANMCVFLNDQLFTRGVLALLYVQENWNLGSGAADGWDGGGC